jgi:peptidoglycan/xylan/chitin deacetylase (PgdA/CDA1 family)
MILLYHNIIEDCSSLDRWHVGKGLPVSQFARQLDWLRNHRRVVSLQDYLRITEYGTLPAKNLVALTFDDGLASTFHRVYPLLNLWNLAATFFVSTAHLDDGGLLWFSYLNALCFDDGYNEIEVQGKALPLRFNEQRKLARRTLGAMARASGAPKQFTHDLAVRYPLSPPTIAEYKGMSGEQLSLFGKEELLECGAHTVNHPFLDQLTLDEQEQEIADSQRRLTELTGRPVRYFAYPKGDYNRDTVRLVKSVGFDAAFATHYKRIGANHRFEITRVGIYSLSFSRFWLKVQGAFTLAHRLGLARL